jgi:hypothetical protein
LHSEGYVIARVALPLSCTTVTPDSAYHLETTEALEEDMQLSLLPHISHRHPARVDGRLSRERPSLRKIKDAHRSSCFTLHAVISFVSLENAHFAI